MAQLDEAQLQADFTAAVHRHHHDLCARGMNPNEACALALRAAAGQVCMPQRLSEVLGAIKAANQRRQYDAALCDMVQTFFASPEALHASFWPCKQQQQQQPKQQTQQQPPWLQIDHAAVDELHAVLQACRSDELRDAVAAGSQQLLLHIAMAARVGRDNPGFCRQVSGLLANPWLEHCECHTLLAAICGVLVELQQYPAPSLSAVGPRALQSGSSSSGGGSSGQLRPSFAQQLQQLLQTWNAVQMKRAVGVLQQYLTMTLYVQQMLTPGCQAATRLLDLLHTASLAAAAAATAAAAAAAANSSHSDASLPLPATSSSSSASTAGGGDHDGGGLLLMSDWYNDAVNEPDFNIKEDYKRWTAPSPPSPSFSLQQHQQHPHQPQQFSFCAFPWVYDPAAKSRILQLENQMQQLEAFERSVLGAFLGGSGCPFLLLRVRRGPFLLSDTLLQINSAKNDGSLKKPLKVKFVGEEGVDEGGLQKEFFQLLVRQCFNPEFGMFVYSDETRLHWFHASSMDLDTEYELIGILIGLAIYNSHILEFQFPLLLYRKLLGRPVGLADLAELHPEIHRSLLKLQAMGAEELESLGLTFQVEMETGFGERATVDLLAPSASSPGTAAAAAAADGSGGNGSSSGGGAAMRVDASNVAAYCEAYAQHLLVTSISRQFAAFQRGFLRLCSGAALQLFRPAELEQLVCGGRVVDLAALEAATSYDDGYTAASQPVRWFWEVVHTLDEAAQKRLLFFITGSDRVPIKGLGHLSPPFVISRVAADDARLPTAHTCFNHLLLPAYSARGVLADRLALALENAEGFGLL